MHSISRTERDGAKHGHARVILLLDMSSLDLFPSTLVVLARSMSGLFFACNLASVQKEILAAHA
jgi:hypothetical protein